MLRVLQQIYHHLPLRLQNLAITLFGIHWYRRRFGGIFKSELRKKRIRQFYNQEQWREYQETELRKLLIHAFETVPYYRSLFRSRGFTRERFAAFNLSDLVQLPLLEKDTFRQMGQTDLLSTRRERRGEFYPSSGSTGTPTRTLYSRRMHQKYFSIYELTINNWAGVDRSMRRGVIGGRRIIQEGDSRPPYYRYNHVEHQVYFSAYHISRRTVANYLEGMYKYRVEYMTGYASANYFLARFIEESGLKAPRLKAVLTSSEKLTQEMRDTFHRVYGCETFDSYNGVEACNLITECEHHRLHIIPDVGIVEVVRDSGEPCLPGETGEIISTGLLNFDQPLIRYRMGDLVKLSEDQHCPCGRSMVVVDEIVGRIEDTVVGPDGREMVRFHGIFIDIPSIMEAQIIQHGYADFEMKLVTSGELPENDRELLRKRMISQLGNIHLRFNMVDSIPRSPSGKFKAVVSHVGRNHNHS